MQTDIDPRSLIGRKAFDRNGTKIGTVDEVYLDDATGVPEWAAVRTGLFSRDAFVPLEPSELVDDALRVPFDRALIKDAPDFGVGRHLSPSRNSSSTTTTASTCAPARRPPGPRLRPRRRGCRPTRRTLGRRPAGSGPDSTRLRRPADPAAPAAAGPRAPAPGSSTRNVRTRPGADPGASNRTVTRPTPLPCTHPCPYSACRTSCPASPAPLGRAPRGSRPPPTGSPRLRRGLRRAPPPPRPRRLGEQILLRVVGEPGDPHPQQPHPTRGVHGLQQPRRGLPHHRRVVRRPAQRLGAGQRREVVPPHLQHDGPPRQPGRPQPPHTPVGQPLHLQPAPGPGRAGPRRRCPRPTPTWCPARPPRAGRRAPAPSAYSARPCALPSSRTSSSSPASAISATVVIPARRRWSPVAGPTPGSVRTDIGASSSRSVPGSISTSPSGLACSEAIFASILDPASPTDPVEPGDGPDVRAQLLPGRPRRRLVAGRAPGLQVDERLVQAQRLHQRRQRPQQLHHLLADLAVEREARHEIRGVRRQPAGLRHRHRRVHPEAPGPRTTRWRRPRAARARRRPPAFPRRLGLDACSAAAKKASMSRCRIVGAVLTSPMLPHATDNRPRCRPRRRRAQTARLRRRASSSAGLCPTSVSPVSTRSPCSCDSALSTSRHTTPTAIPKTPWPPWSRSHDLVGRGALVDRRAVAHQRHALQIAEARAPAGAARRCGCSAATTPVSRNRLTIFRTTTSRKL